MVDMVLVQWGLAAIPWTLALVVLSFNIRRQAINQRRYEAGDDSRVSGVPFLFTFFCWIGVGISPWEFNAFWLLCVLFELPAVGNFISEPEPREDDASTDEAHDTTEGKQDSSQA